MNVMAKTITLKNLPDALHARISKAFKNNRHSLNSEAILSLEAGLGKLWKTQPLPATMVL